jgi:hypothetical protein
MLSKQLSFGVKLIASIMENKDIRTLAQQIQLDCLIQDDFCIAERFAKKADLFAREGSANSNDGFYVSFRQSQSHIRIVFGFRPSFDLPTEYVINVRKVGFEQYHILMGSHLKPIEADIDDVYNKLAKEVDEIYRELRQEADKEQERLAKDEEKYQRNNSTF